MQCERCGEDAVTQRRDSYFCGRCALRADWENVALTVQGMAVRSAPLIPEAVPVEAAPRRAATPGTPPPTPAPPGPPPATAPSPADPFAH